MLTSLRLPALACAALLCMPPMATAGQSGPKSCRAATLCGTPSLRLGGNIGLRLGKSRVSIGFGQRRAMSCCSTQPGYYRAVSEKIWVQGAPIQTWVPARYEWRKGRYGSVVQVLVQQGYFRTDYGPGHYATRNKKVWVPTRTVCGQGRHRH
ncbi:MAG TPA: hypothetical protein EYQ74_01275 [Planctomycetes bacterium]|nr:hypothetical protein [Planctomycetota bacterium]HIK60704.1 hypothetical protein [Planctomycetota bacterium]